MTQRKRYALVGTGARAGMFVDAITTTYKDTAELVAFCDQSQTRMDWYNGRIQNERGLEPLPTYPTDQFEQMVAEGRRLADLAVRHREELAGAPGRVHRCQTDKDRHTCGTPECVCRR